MSRSSARWDQSDGPCRLRADESLQLPKRVGIVDAGYTFNLRERALETLLEARSANTATEVLRGDGAAG